MDGLVFGGMGDIISGVFLLSILVCRKVKHKKQHKKINEKI